MPPNALASTDDVADTSTADLTQPAESVDSLFERVAWLYAFCREHLFRNDTARIISTIWSNAAPPCGTKVIELGCGPGFYSRKLAQRFPQISVVGVDRSQSQVRSARQRSV